VRRRRLAAWAATAAAAAAAERRWQRRRQTTAGVRRRWKKMFFCVFSILMSKKEAVCPDGRIVPAVFRVSGFYCNSLTYRSDQFTIVKSVGEHQPSLSPSPKFFVRFSLPPGS
jgi:hypothetical protein